VKRTIVQTPAARRDLEDIFVYLGRKSRQSADRFLSAARRTFALLADRPGIGARYEPDDPTFERIRICPVTRFRSYLIVYRTMDDRLDILHVFHAARDIDRMLANEFGAPDQPDAP
jgi:toxin ParE1/3/4